MDWFEEKKAEFYRKLEEFAALYKRLKGTYSIIKDDPKLLAEYYDLMDRAEDVKAAIQKVGNYIDIGIGWVKTALNIEEPRNELGFSVIAIGVIMAAIAAMSYVGGDIYKFVRKAEEVEKIAAETGSRQNAYNIVNARTDWETIAKWGAVIAVSIYVVPPLLKGFKRGYKKIA